MFYLGHLLVQLITFLCYFFRWYLYFCDTNKLWFDLYDLIW